MGGLLGLPAEDAACPRGGLELPRRGILPLHVANSEGDVGNGWRARRPLALSAVTHARVHLRCMHMEYGRRAEERSTVCSNQARVLCALS